MYSLQTFPNSSFFEWFNRTKVSQNWKLIGTFIRTVQFQHLKLRPQSYILFCKVFFDKEHSKPRPPRQIFVAGIVWVPTFTHFFLILPFQNLWLKVVPKKEKIYVVCVCVCVCVCEGGGGGWYCVSLIIEINNQ